MFPTLVSGVGLLSVHFVFSGFLRTFNDKWWYAVLRFLFYYQDSEGTGGSNDCLMKNKPFYLTLLGVFLWVGCTFKPPIPTESEILSQIRLEPKIDKFVFGVSIGSALDSYNFKLKRPPRQALIKDGILLPGGVYWSKLNPKYNDKFIEVNEDNARYVYATPHLDGISFISAGPAGYDTSRYMIALVGYHYEVTDWAKRINKYNSSHFADISGTKEYLLEYDRNLKRWNCVCDLNW